MLRIRDRTLHIRPDVAEDLDGYCFNILLEIVLLRRKKLMRRSFPERPVSRLASGGKVTFAHHQFYVPCHSSHILVDQACNGLASRAWNVHHLSCCTCARMHTYIYVRYN